MAEPVQFDLIVIGAGILGAGVAQAAAAAGYRVLVIERTAPAAGASSRSSKLIHGGLRYLETAQFGLVREALREQRLLLRNAPELVHRLPFYLPVYRQGTRRPLTLRAGLSLYWLLGSRPGFKQISLRHWDNPDGLDTRDIQALFLYHDAQTDDEALTRAVLHSAQTLGARLECPAELTRIERLPWGYKVFHTQNGNSRENTTTTLVNAAGPWVNTVLRRLVPPEPDLPIELVQGSHILLHGELQAGGYYVEAPDRRAVFILP